MNNNQEIAIKVSQLNKSFKLPHEKNNSVKSVIINPFKKRTFEKQVVLRDVNFEIKKGDFFGIVGRNGSGKSTLLKILAGIYCQDKGKIDITGKLTPFIELGVGFNQDLTGRENVFLNGALLGYNRKEMNAIYDEIVEFAELEKFMDQKLKNYSSGMQVRLAFSIAIQSKSDIYLFDEVLAVGDSAFQQKCYEHFKYLKSVGKTVVLVSHDTSALQMFCNNGIYLEEGKIQKEGSIKDVLQDYAEQNLKKQELKIKINSLNKPKKVVETSKEVNIVNVKILFDGKTRNTFRPREKIYIKYEFKANTIIDNPVFGLVIQDASGGKPIFATNTLDTLTKTGMLLPGKVKNVIFEIENIFDDGKYYISGAIANNDRTNVYTRFHNVASFSSIGWLNTAKGSVFLEHNIKINF